jgi:hypothetical protein
MNRKRRKYTRSMFDRARKAIAEVPVHEETIHTWEKAMEQIGEVDEKRVVAIEVGEGGKIKVELEPLSSGVANPRKA